ncbi:hypothetical protein HK104_002313 [Borealophlyctis nickersoniae]|nr:hypothetical protein HK104_002313 [Borealophlyctis nickersoniae]
MAPPPRTVKVHFQRSGATMTYSADDQSTTAHLMQAIADHIGFSAVEQQKTLRYRFLSIPPLTPQQFVECDIRGLIRLSPLFPVEVLQQEVSRIEHLATASHKTKTRDADADADDGGKQGGGRVKSGRMSWRDLARRGKKTWKLIQVGGEAGKVGEGAPPIKVEPGVGGGGGGGVPIKVEPGVGGGGGGQRSKPEVIVIDDD